ncbi:TPM domain-containing protein [Novosphingobium aquae]|uniref:TPM domain-containing protein n=1 Tax=Novosphingobium aquae TaxID=3133435 RepID=A0ABU8S651_9SPHN
MLGQTGRLPTHRLTRLAALLLAALSSLLALPAQAQTFPELTGRVVDGANIIPDDVEARLVQKLDGLEKQSQRQLVVVTLPDLQGYEISDYGYQLGRHWGIGDKERNDGVLLIVAPTERKVRIEVGYGLEPILTDGLSSLIMQNQIVPAFKAGNMPAGIEAGADAIIKQLTLPADEAAKVAQQAQAQPKAEKSNPLAVIFFIFVFFMLFILPAIIRSRSGGRRYRDDSGLGTVVMWSVLEGLAHGSSRGGGGGFSGGGFGGGGGFSGGGGSFGGGGSSGSW